MSIVTPKLLNIAGKGDVKVWELRSESGRVIYYERHDRPGFIPIGVKNLFYLGGTRVTSCDVVRSNVPPVILKEKDGYTAQSSWYISENDISIRK